MKTTIPLGFILLILIRNFIVVANGRFSVKSYCLVSTWGLLTQFPEVFVAFQSLGFVVILFPIYSRSWMSIDFFGYGLRISEVWRYFYESPTVSLFFYLSLVYSSFLDYASLFLTNRMCFSFLMQWRSYFFLIFMAWFSLLFLTS